MAPLVKDFIPQIVDFFWCQGIFSNNIFVVIGVLGYESPLSKEREVVFKSFFFCKFFDSPEEGVSWDSSQGVLYSSID